MVPFGQKRGGNWIKRELLRSWQCSISCQKWWLHSLCFEIINLAMHLCFVYFSKCVLYFMRKNGFWGMQLCRTSQQTTLRQLRMTSLQLMSMGSCSWAYSLVMSQVKYLYRVSTLHFCCMIKFDGQIIFVTLPHLLLPVIILPLSITLPNKHSNSFYC